MSVEIISPTSGVAQKGDNVLTGDREGITFFGAYLPEQGGSPNRWGKMLNWSIFTLGRYLSYLYSTVIRFRKTKIVFYPGKVVNPAFNEISLIDNKAPYSYAGGKHAWSFGVSPDYPRIELSVSDDDYSSSSYDPESEDFSEPVINKNIFLANPDGTFGFGSYSGIYRGVIHIESASYDKSSSLVISGKANSAQQKPTFDYEMGVCHRDEESEKGAGLFIRAIDNNSKSLTIANLVPDTIGNPQKSFSIIPALEGSIGDAQYMGTTVKILSSDGNISGIFLGNCKPGDASSEGAFLYFEKDSQYETGYLRVNFGFLNIATGVFTKKNPINLAKTLAQSN